MKLNKRKRINGQLIPVDAGNLRASDIGRTLVAFYLVPSNNTMFEIRGKIQSIRFNNRVAVRIKHGSFTSEQLEQLQIPRTLTFKLDDEIYLK